MPVSSNVSHHQYRIQTSVALSHKSDCWQLCVFRSIVTDRFGIVTAEFGNVTDRFGDVTDGVLKAV